MCGNLIKIFMTSIKYIINLTGNKSEVRRHKLSIIKLSYFEMLLVSLLAQVIDKISNFLLFALKKINSQIFDLDQISEASR